MEQFSNTPEQLQTGSLRNQFLIAMPSLSESNFAHSLIYICEHSADGTMGLIINRPMEIPLSRVYEQLKLGQTDPSGEKMLLSGGPVGIERGFVLHPTSDQSWESTLRISPQISLTASRDIIADMALGNGPSDAVVMLGYASWSPGQLEAEIADNAWLTVQADADIIFHTPFEDRIRAAASSIGVDLSKLSSSSGHA